MTWLIRISVPSSMPLATLTSVAPSVDQTAPTRSRLARIVCAGTASSTVVTPRQRLGRRRWWRGCPAAARRPGQIVRVVPGGIDLVGDVGAPGPQPDLARTTRVREHLGQRRAPCAGAHHRTAPVVLAIISSVSVVGRFTLEQLVRSPRRWQDGTHWRDGRMSGAGPTAQVTSA